MWTGEAAEQQKRVFGTHACDRGSLTQTIAETKHDFARGDLVGGAKDKTAPVDHSCIGWTLDRAPSNATVSWGERGEAIRFGVTPTRTYEAPNGERCRDYVVTMALGKGLQRMENSACRDDNGAWHFGSPYADFNPANMGPRPWPKWTGEPPGPPIPTPTPGM